MRKCKAIETLYRGRYFRSRTEARFAVWFDEMGIGWNYEMVGFQVGDDWYLPDFLIPDWNCHIEIKPGCMSENDEARITRIMQAWRHDTDLMMLSGIPSEGQYVGVRMETLQGDDRTAQRFVFADCRRCNGVSYVFEDESGWGMYGKHNCGETNERWPDTTGPRIMRAYKTAMSKRFDHLSHHIKKPGPDFSEPGRREGISASGLSSPA